MDSSFDSRNLELKTYVASLKRRSPYLDSSYLKGLRDGTLSREEFTETQIQFFSAVSFFSRPMAALASRIPQASLRRVLLDNVADEHGSGNLDMSHEQTFLRFLSRLGVESDGVRQRPLWPEVRAFNTVLNGVASLDDPTMALATFGIIEDMFSSISADIGSSVIARGFLAADQIVHYATHETLDIEHAEGFYSGIALSYAHDAQARHHIQQGLELGRYVFLRLYDDLWKQRQRRWLHGTVNTRSTVNAWVA